MLDLKSRALKTDEGPLAITTESLNPEEIPQVLLQDLPEAAGTTISEMLAAGAVIATHLQI